MPPVFHEQPSGPGSAAGTRPKLVMQLMVDTLRRRRIRAARREIAMSLPMLVLVRDRVVDAQGVVGGGEDVPGRVDRVVERVADDGREVLRRSNACSVRVGRSSPRRRCTGRSTRSGGARVGDVDLAVGAGLDEGQVALDDVRVDVDRARGRRLAPCRPSTSCCSRGGGVGRREVQRDGVGLRRDAARLRRRATARVPLITRPAVILPVTPTLCRVSTIRVES